MDCLEPCYGFLKGFLVRESKDPAQERAEFERTVAFLASVPLFRQQLPRSELPKVAQHLTRKLWLPGQRLVRQGEVGRAFFLIQQGEALVVTSENGSPEHVRCVLAAGDYFGGHTLTTERPNVATIAAGAEELTTLSMSRKEFEDLGLARWLHFPKRPALYGDSPDQTPGVKRMATVAADMASSGDAPPEADVEFIRTAITSNANLRALLQVSQDKLQELAMSATEMKVEKGEVIGKAGDIGHEFFVVREGTVEACVESCLRGGSGAQQSAESAVAHSTMAERFLRKQHCLQELATAKKVGNQNRVTASMYTAGGMPQAAPEKDRKRNRLRSEYSELKKKASDFDRQVSDNNEASRRKISMRSKMMDRFRTRSNVDHAEVEQLQAQTLPECTSNETDLVPGESFGELSILYNMHMHATFKAKTDCVLYVIHRRNFAAAFNRKGKRFHEICKLLEEVALLSPLLSSELWELACNATGFVDFQPGERVLHQGRVRETRRWYIIYHGSAVVLHQSSEDAQPQQLATLTRAGHFGERSLLRGDAAAPIHVDAGPEGMCCLTFHGESTRVLLQKVMAQDALPSVQCDLKEWWVRKARGFQALRKGSNNKDAWDPFARCTVEMDQLKKVCTLGKGGFGVVLLVQDEHEKRYALKVLSKGHIEAQRAQRLVCWERELMSMLDSNFCIRLHRTFKDSQHVYFLLECALGGSLMSLVRDHPEVFNEDMPRGSSVGFYIGCITAALEHLHERRIVHRDLKPENILLDEEGYGKVCDMGFARFVISKTNTLAGTPEYMAPEMIDFPHTHGCAVDWWALGVLSFELVAGQTPFQDEGICNPVGRLLAIRRSQDTGALQYPFHFPYILKPIVSKLLLHNQNERLGAGPAGAKEVREQPFFKAIKFDFEALHRRTLKSPYQKAWHETDMTPSSNLQVDDEGLGLEDSDSIFIKHTPTSYEQWDGQF